MRAEVTPSMYDTSAKVNFSTLSLSSLAIWAYSAQKLRVTRWVGADGSSLAKELIFQVMMITGRMFDTSLSARRMNHLIDWVKARERNIHYARAIQGGTVLLASVFYHPNGWSECESYRNR